MPGTTPIVLRAIDRIAREARDRLPQLSNEKKAAALQQAVDPLVNILKTDPHFEHRSRAAYQLRFFAGESDAAYNALRHAFENDSSNAVKGAAHGSLGYVGYGERRK